MFKANRLKKTIINALVFVLLLSNLLPFNLMVMAQESSPSAIIETPLASQSATLSPTEEILPTTTPTLIPDIKTLPSLTPAPIATVSPTLSPTLFIEQNPTSVPSATIKQPIIMRLVSNKNLQANQSLAVELLNTKNNPYQVLLTKNGQAVKTTTKEQTIGETTVLIIRPPLSFRPGKFLLKVTDSTGHTEEQEVLWGMLTINFNKSVYLPKEKADLGITFFNESGSVDCNAKISLTIKNDQLGIVDELSTSNGKISLNPECQLRSYYLTPDYSGSYQLGEAGIYQLQIIAQNKSGNYSFTDSIEVKNNLVFDIERQAPSKIFSAKTYPSTIEVTASQDFNGTVVETVPESFNIIPASGSADIKSFDKVETTNLSLEKETSIGTLSAQLRLPFAGNYPLTLEFGEQPDDPNLQEEYQKAGAIAHDGVDFALPENTPVLAIDDGQVVATSSAIYGLTVEIKHSWGKSYYGHLSSLTANLNQEIKRGDQIAFSGSSGLSTGPHLHLAIQPNDSDITNGYLGKINPAPYLGISKTSQSVLVKQISWQLSLKKGEKISLGYRLVVSGIGSQIYLFEPLKLLENGKTTYQESRQWQLTADQSTEQVLGVATQRKKIRRLKLNENNNQLVNVLGYETPEFEFDLNDNKFNNLWQKNDLDIKNLIRNQTSHEKVKLEKEIVNNVEVDAFNKKIIVSTPTVDGFRPGVYKFNLTIPSDQGEINITQDFTWGVLALNPDKSIYTVGDTSLISIGVLNDKGQIVCDAEVTLIIKDPAGKETTRSTKNGGITISENCPVKDTFRGPDYFTNYIVNLVGTYTMTLTATQNNQSYTIIDNFQAEETPRFSVKRTGPTRVWPVKYQPMTLTIVANENFEGEIVERLPKNFQVQVGPEVKVNQTDEDLEISWYESMVKGDIVTFSYSFKAPEKSPDFYLLGPLTIGSWQESRAWQLAIDTTYMYLFWDGVGAPGNGWTVITTYDGKFPIGASDSTTFGTAGGGLTHTPTINGSVTQTTGTTNTQVGVATAGTYNNTFVHTHTSLAVTPVAANNLPAYRSLKLMKYDTGIPTSILSGAIALFDADPDANWAKQTDQNSRLIQANSSVTSAGSDSHQHTLTWQQLGGNTTQRVDRGATNFLAAASGHTHTAPAQTSTALVSNNSLPPYTSVIVAKVGSTVTMPVGMIALFDANPGTAWTVKSNAGGDFDGQFARGAASYAAKAGGSTTHSHATETSGDSAGAGSTAKGTAAGTGSAAAGQTHKLQVSFNTNESNVPSDFAVVYAKKNPVAVSGKILQEAGSGTYEGTDKWTSCNGSTTNISWALDSVDQTNIYCGNSDGAFSFQPTLTSANQVITIWLDTNGGDKGVLYVKNNDTISDISGLTVYKDRVWLQSESSASITNGTINTFDQSSNDTDIPIASDGTNATVDAGVEIHVNTSDTYAPGGNVTADKLHIKGTYTGGSETLQLNGFGTSTCNATVANIRPLCIDSGVYTSTTNTTTFKGISNSNLESAAAYYNLTIYPSSGTPAFTALAATTVNKDLVIAAGTLAMSTYGLTVGSDSNANSGSIKVGGIISQSSSALTTIKNASGSNCIGANDVNCAGTPGTIGFFNLTIGSGATTFSTTINGTSVVVSVGGALTISNNATLSANGTLNVAGNWDNSAGGVFTKNSSSVVLNGAGGSTQIIYGPTEFYDLSATVSTTARFLTFTQGTTQTVTHGLVLTGTAGNLLTLQSSNSPTKWLINTTGIASPNLDYLTVNDSQSTLCIYAAHSSGSSNTNWDFIGTGCVAAGPTTEQQMRHGDWFNSSEIRQPFTF